MAPETFFGFFSILYVSLCEVLIHWMWPICIPEAGLAEFM